MKKAYVTIIVILLIGLVLYMVYPSSPPAPERVPILTSFEPQGLTFFDSDFWYWNGERYGLVYLKNKTPMAYYQAGVFYLGYNEEGQATPNPRIYVFDMWRGDEHSDKCKQSFAFNHAVSGWDDIEAIMGDAELRKSRLPRLNGVSAERACKELLNQMP